MTAHNKDTVWFVSYLLIIFLFFPGPCFANLNAALAQQQKSAPDCLAPTTMFRSLQPHEILNHDFPLYLRIRAKEILAENTALLETLDVQWVQIDRSLQEGRLRYPGLEGTLTKIFHQVFMEETGLDEAQVEDYLRLCDHIRRWLDENPRIAHEVLSEIRERFGEKRYGQFKQEYENNYGTHATEEEFFRSIVEREFFDSLLLKDQFKVLANNALTNAPWAELKMAQTIPDWDIKKAIFHNLKPLESELRQFLYSSSLKKQYLSRHGITNSSVLAAKDAVEGLSLILSWRHHGELVATNSEAAWIFEELKKDEIAWEKEHEVNRDQESHAAAIRSKAAYILGLIGGKRARVSLTHSLREDSHPWVRSAAARAMGSIANLRSSDELIRALRTDTEPNVRLTVAATLGMLKERSSLPALFQALHDPDGKVASIAATAIAAFRDPDTIEPLMSLLAHPDPQVASVAAESLASLKPLCRQAIRNTILNAIMQGENEKPTSSMALLLNVKILEEAGNKDDLPILHVLSASPSSELRLVSILVMIKIGGSDEIDRLLEAAKDSYPGIRVVAMESLGKSGIRDVIPAVMEGIYDRVEEVRLEALKALSKLSDAREAIIEGPAFIILERPHRYKVSVPSRSEIVRRLIANLHDPSFDVRLESIYALDRWGRKQAALPLMKCMLGDRSHRIRGEAAKVLGKLGDFIVPAIADMLANKDWEVRSAAVAALGQIQSERAIDLLVKSLDDPSWSIRGTTLHYLGQSGDVRAVPGIKRWMAGLTESNDENRMLENMANNVIRTIYKRKIFRALDHNRLKSDIREKVKSLLLSGAGVPALTPSRVTELVDGVVLYETICHLNTNSPKVSEDEMAIIAEAISEAESRTPAIIILTTETYQGSLNSQVVEEHISQIAL